jgi:hypothetical protein
VENENDDGEDKEKNEAIHLFLNYCHYIRTQ